MPVSCSTDLISSRIMRAENGSTEDFVRSIRTPSRLTPRVMITSSRSFIGGAVKSTAANAEGGLRFSSNVFCELMNGWELIECPVLSITFECGVVV